jgi:hypothetical protein
MSKSMRVQMVLLVALHMKVRIFGPLKTNFRGKKSQNPDF